MVFLQLSTTCPPWGRSLQRVFGEPLIVSNCYNHLLSAVLFIILFLSILFVCGTLFLLTLFIAVALELLKVILGLFTLLRCMCFSVRWYVFFFSILLSKALILALGYGTDCIFHLRDIGQFHLKKIINKFKKSM